MLSLYSCGKNNSEAEKNPESNSKQTSEEGGKREVFTAMTPEIEVEIKAQESADQRIARNVYFSDTHVHTGWSVDAELDGAILTPDDAFRFALGEEVTSNSGLKAKPGRPLRLVYPWRMKPRTANAGM